MNFKKTLKQKNEGIKDLITSPNPRPKRDWVFMVYFSFSIFVFSLVLNSILFFQEKQSEREERGTEDVASASDGKIEGYLLEGSDLDDIWLLFKEKEERFNLILEELEERETETRPIQERGIGQEEVVDEAETAVREKSEDQDIFGELIQ